MLYFSFSLYGTNPKYTYGMIANAELIQKYYPDAGIIIYIADDVPQMIRDKLAAYSQITLIDLGEVDGCSPFFNRFCTIDKPDCDIMIVRDADSRIHARDRGCIDDFLARTDKSLLIIRDHASHWFPIMGGMWGIRKKHLRDIPIIQMINDWKYSFSSSKYFDDQLFLLKNMYRIPDALIFDRSGYIEPVEMHTPFRIPLEDDLFVGQVHDFKEDGTEYAVWPA
jgi:hypothetical protein